MWLQRLPNNIQTILACSADALPALAVMANKIFETSEDHSIRGIFSFSNTNNDLVHVIHDLRDKIEVLQKDIHESKPRIGSKSPNRKQTPTRFTNDYCWYHKMYKHKAKKCNSPCSFKTRNQKN